MGHATTPVSSGLARLLRQETSRLERQAKRARAGDTRGVHQARVASRRLREMLGVAASDAAVNVRPVRRDVRRLTGKLGPIRELDVACAVWHESDDPDRWTASLVEMLDRRAELDRRRHVAGMRSALDRVIGGRLGRELAAVADAVEDRGASRVIAAAMAASLRRRSQDVLRSLAETGTAYVPGPLHDVRIAVKKLRYAAELARDPGGARVGRGVGHLKRVQDRLGRIHDLQIVQERLQAMAAKGRLTRAALAGLEASDAALEVECRQLHGRLVAGMPALARLVERFRDETAVELMPRRAARMAKVKGGGASDRRRIGEDG
jgi:CHAD domain-containing protein